MKNSEEEDLVVIYNRVPKTGSTSFMKIVYDLHKINQFSAVYVNVSGKIMNLATEVSFVQNVTRWKSIRPAIFHGHFRHLNFAKFGSSLSPVYINIIRDPLQRLVSHYYFLRYGDNFRPHKVRQRMGDHTVSTLHCSLSIWSNIEKLFPAYINLYPPVRTLLKHCPTKQGRR